MKRLLGLLVVLFSCALAAQSRGPIELANAQVPEARRIPYGTDRLQFGELRVPSTRGPHPVAVIVHGGCWLSTLPSLNERVLGLDHLRPLAAALTEAGIATWSVEYRRVGHEGGGWPGTFQDVARGADFVRTLAKPNNLDLTRTIAVGHSAGGHLVMWLAGRARIPKSSELYTANPLPLSGVVSLDGPPDLKATVSIIQPICGQPVITNLLGGSPDERPERYRAASPTELLPLGVRQEFFVGRMFAAQAAPYDAATKKAGDAVHMTVLPEAGHFLFIDPQSTLWPQVLAGVQRLLAQ